MSQNYIPIDYVVNDYIMSIDDDDYGATPSDYMVRQYALRGIREFGFDISHNIKTEILDVNLNLGTVELPCDYVDMVKLGQLGPADQFTFKKAGFVSVLGIDQAQLGDGFTGVSSGNGS